MLIKKIVVTIITLITVSFSAVAAVDCDAMPASAGTNVDTSDTSTVKKSGVIARFLNYFKDSNKEKRNKRFDFSVIGGPHYSSDTKLGLGVVAAGFYRKNLTDTVTPPSNISLYGDISTVGFWMIGLRGDHIFTDDRRRIDYNVYFYSFPRRFWGIGYDAGKNASDYTDFRELYLKASVDFLWRVGSSFYVGPALEFQRTVAEAIEPDELFRWQGEKLNTTTAGAGFRLQYDTRDNLTAATRGVYAALEQRYYPAFLCNQTGDFGYSDVRVYGYRPVWKGGVLAGAFHSRLSYGRVPWSQLSTFGGSSTMRGYYDGRFRDKGETDVTVELRQHIWRRNGMAVWLGAGTVYPRLSAFRLRHVLPNGGIGYRWEFKARTNVRVDLGFGRGETSFIFSINEAF